MKKVETIFYPHLQICFCQFINIVVILYTIWNFFFWGEDHTIFFNWWISYIRFFGMSLKRIWSCLVTSSQYNCVKTFMTLFQVIFPHPTVVAFPTVLHLMSHWLIYFWCSQFRNTMVQNMKQRKERKTQKLIMKIFHCKVSVLCIKEPASVP